MAFSGLAVKAAIAGVTFAVMAALAAWTIVEREAAPRIHASVEDLPQARAGLVLGTSRLLPGRYPNPYFEYRIDAAAKLYESGKVDYLIVSGNQSQGGRPDRRLRRAQRHARRAGRRRRAGRPHLSRLRRLPHARFGAARQQRVRPGPRDRRVAAFPPGARALSRRAARPELRRAWRQTIAPLAPSTISTQIAGSRARG